jgi:hypothetical protein
VEGFGDFGYVETTCRGQEGGGWRRIGKDAIPVNKRCIVGWVVKELITLFEHVRYSFTTSQPCLMKTLSAWWGCCKSCSN